MKNFNVGDIVTIKTHPLFNKIPKKINGFPAQVPPLMLVKEVFFEKEDKKKLYSDSIENAQIADLIKYNCVYFNSNKSEFEEKVIFASFLDTYLNLNYYREFKKDEKTTIELDKQLIPEVLKYKEMSNYQYGKIVQFKTKKLEHRKSYNEGSFEKVNTSFQTPDFVLSGLKNVEQVDLFYPDGKVKKLVSAQLFKIMWFNHSQQKFSEHYLPKEFFVQELEI